MRQETIKVSAPNGLHGRKLSKFIDQALKFQSQIIIFKDGKSVNAKSLMGLLAISVLGGDTIELMVDGNDEDKAFETLVEEINRYVA